MTVPSSHLFFFVIDIFVIWDLKRKNLITNPKFIKSIAGRLGQHLISMVGAFTAGWIGSMIGSLICPILGSFIGGLTGVILGPLIIDFICEKYIMDSIKDEV